VLNANLVANPCARPRFFLNKQPYIHN
jgi:hypothetical protein